MPKIIRKLGSFVKAKDMSWLDLFRNNVIGGLGEMVSAIVVLMGFIRLMNSDRRGARRNVGAKPKRSLKERTQEPEGLEPEKPKRSAPAQGKARTGIRSTGTSGFFNHTLPTVSKYLLPIFSLIVFIVVVFLNRKLADQNKALFDASQVMLDVQRTVPVSLIRKDLVEKEIESLDQVFATTGNPGIQYTVASLQASIGKYPESTLTFVEAEKVIGRKTASTQCGIGLAEIGEQKLSEAEHSLDAALALTTSSEKDPFAPSTAFVQHSIHANYVLLYVYKARAGMDISKCVSLATIHYNAARRVREVIDESDTAELENNLAVLFQMMARDLNRHHESSETVQRFITDSADHFSNGVQELGRRLDDQYVSALFNLGSILCAIPQRRDQAISTLRFLASVLSYKHSDRTGAAYLLIGDAWSDSMLDAKNEVECGAFRDKARQAFTTALSLSQQAGTENAKVTSFAQVRLSQLEKKFRDAVVSVRRLRTSR
jgi:tetratricopeptide (TPR) repeat protein